MTYKKETDNYILQEDLEQIANSNLDWELLAGKTFFITGATGLIGKELVLALLTANRIHSLDIYIYALVRSIEKANNVFGDLVKRSELNLIQGNVEDQVRMIPHIDYIIHLASQTASKEFITHPVETIDTSLFGTKSVLELALKNQCSSVVYASSMEAYGDVGIQEKRTTEEQLGYINNLNVRSCYPEAKRMCECMCACYASEFAIPVKIARLAQTFGAGVSRTEGRVFAQFARSAMEHTDIVLHTPGNSYGNYCYTADAITGLLTILLYGNPGEAYNVVNESCTMRIAEMAKLVSDKIAKGNIKTVFDIPNENTYGYAPDVELRLSGSKLKKLGWEPVIAPDMTAMYLRLIESFRSEKELITI